jgi:hypothetical protein
MNAGLPPQMIADLANTFQICGYLRGVAAVFISG